MATRDFRLRQATLLLVAACGVGLACSGNISGKGQPPGGGGNGGAGGTGHVDPGKPTQPDAPFDDRTAALVARKVKNLLTGLAPTDDDVAALKMSGAAGLQKLISTWMMDMNFQDFFKDKM